ncbi:DUF1801 domain-containing protein [Candidatus Microgenomates bacterium]|nr:DUF1801 domain-containing protein [Candidatus Microgenomates bacterium]
MATPKPPASIDSYIASSPKNVRPQLEKIRQTIHEVVPEAIELISYQIPSFNLYGTLLISFAAWTRHIAIYPVPSGDAAFRKEISPYIGSKSTVRFAIDKPIPYDLVKQIVAFRIAEI